MTALTINQPARVETVSATAYEVPTATDEESDGTLRWSSTSIVVVEIAGGGLTGLGYTYCHAAAAHVIETTLAGILTDADPLMPERCWTQMQVALRQLGHAGVAAMALSAVDIALWDLKAKLLGVCLADALPRFQDSVAIYGSGGFTSYSDSELRDQATQWAQWGLGRVKIKVGRDKALDLARVRAVREVVGHDVELMVDGNGAYSVQEALWWADQFADDEVRWFEEPVSSEDLAGLAEVRRKGPAGLEIAAGEYGWDLPYFQRMLDAGAVDVLQADVTRCGGITNMLRVDGLCKARNLPFSAHCAPAVSAHVCCAMETARHIEYFFDHYRIESMLFTGAAKPDGGRLTPDRDRPGHGLAFKHEHAQRFAITNGASA